MPQALVVQLKDISVQEFRVIRYASHDKLSLYARDYAAAGEAARLPVICLHGLTRNSSDFDELAPWLAARGHRVIVPDIRGRGYSDYDSNHQHYALETYVDDVRMLCELLGIGRAIFIGTSMGGLITMLLSWRSSGLVHAAVINDIGPELDQAGIQRILSYAGQALPLDTWQQAVSYIKTINQAAFPENSEAEWEKWAKRAFTLAADGKPALRYDPPIARLLAGGKLQADVPLLKFAFLRLCHARACLLVRGEISDLLSQSHVAELCAAAPALQVLTVPGIGHAPMLTESVVLQKLAEFLPQQQ